jgi:hypothetical protein
MQRRIQIAGLIMSFLYAAVIVWLYSEQPRSLHELRTQAAVGVSLYAVNQANFDEAVRQFDLHGYRSALVQFELADPAGKDPKTQFYRAYCCYVLGRGLILNDEELFQAGLGAIDRCLAESPNHIFESDRNDVEIRNGDDLRGRLVDGLKRTPSRMNPINWFRKH